jgi:hypothetical protein
MPVSIPSLVYRFLLLWYSRSIFVSLLSKSWFGISLCTSQAVWLDPVKSRSKVDFCCRCFTCSSISVMHHCFSHGFLSSLTLAHLHLVSLHASNLDSFFLRRRFFCARLSTWWLLLIPPPRKSSPGFSVLLPLHGFSQLIRSSVLVSQQHVFSTR